MGNGYGCEKIPELLKEFTKFRNQENSCLQNSKMVSIKINFASKISRIVHTFTKEDKVKVNSLKKTLILLQKKKFEIVSKKKAVRREIEFLLERISFSQRRKISVKKEDYKKLETLRVEKRRITASIVDNERNILRTTSKLEKIIKQKKEKI